MRVVVIGATGNVGTSVLEALRNEHEVEEILAVARRSPVRTYPRTTFIPADITRSELEPIVRGADAVVLLAWLIQPGRDERVTRGVNVAGNERVLQAVVQAGVPAVLYASSIGAYSPGPKDRRVDESWPTEGIPSSFYARHKAEVERMLDRLERDQPQLRVVRMRPALIFKREAATEIRRLFAGPLLPRRLVTPDLIPIVPDVPGLRFQALHSLDVGDAFRRALTARAAGPFNVAAEPVLDPAKLAEILHARRVKVAPGVLRALAAVTFKLRMQPSEPGWVDMALSVPLMDCARARSELGWEPAHSSTDALLELLEGIRTGDDLDTPPLARAASGPARLRELWTGVGARP